MASFKEHIERAKRTGNIEFYIEERTDAYVLSRMPVTQGMLNPFGTVQAGALIWMADVTATVMAIGKTEIGEDGFVKRLIEKPKEMYNNLAVVGFYYFKESADLISAIQAQMEKELSINGEYFLADAVNIMIERGAKMTTQRVNMWLDAGTAETVLKTNKHLLNNGHDNSTEVNQRTDVTVIPPVFVHPSADVRSSVIGPHASIGANCVINNSVIRGSIVEDNAKLEDIILEGSLIGQNAHLQSHPRSFNIGDNSEICL